MSNFLSLKYILDREGIKHERVPHSRNVLIRLPFYGNESDQGITANAVYNSVL